MDLKEFYFQNIKESEYHYRFLNSIKKVNYTYNIFCGEEETQNYQFEIDDVEEAITKFKELCQPNVDFSGENKCWFYLITYYLHTLGYQSCCRLVCLWHMSIKERTFGDQPASILETGFSISK